MDATPTVVPLLCAAARSASSKARAQVAPCLEALAEALKAGSATLIDVSESDIAHLLSSVVAQKTSWVADGTQLVDMIRAAIKENDELPASAKKGGKKASGQPKGAGSAVGTLLSRQLAAVDGVPTRAQLEAAAFALEATAGLGAAGAQLAAAQPLLVRLLAPAAAEAAATARGLEVVERVCARLTADAFKGLSAAGGDPAGLGAKLADILSTDAPAPVRLALLKSLTSDVWAALPSVSQSAVLVALMLNASRESVDHVRLAARSALESLGVSSAHLEPFLLAVASPSTSSDAPATASKSRAGKKSKRDAAEPATVPGRPVLVGAEHALELLLWKNDVAGAERLIQPICSVIERLLPHVQPLVVSSSSRTDADEEAAMEVDEAAAATALGIQASYMVQLSLSALEGICGRLVGARDGAKHAKQAPLPLVLRCAREAADAAGRNAALRLLGVLAAILPQEAIEHVLEVLKLVGDASAASDDSYTQLVTSRVLVSVVPAWISSGNSAADLIAVVADALDSIPSHRRLGLLMSLLEPMPQDSGAHSVACVVLLERGIAKRVAKASEEEAAQLPSLASPLLRTLPVGDRISALAGVLRIARERMGTKTSADLTALSAALASDELPRLKVEVRTQQDPGHLAASQQATQQLLLVTVELLQAIGAALAKAGAADAKLGASMEGVYRLLEGLEGIVASDGFLQSLHGLIKSSKDLGVKRRVLRLLSSRLDTLGQDAVSLAEEMIMSKEQRNARDTRTTDAAVAICDALLPLMDGADKACAAEATGVTRQAALVALHALAKRYGAARPQPILACVPGVLQCLKDGRSPVRSSALVCLAAMAVSLGPRVLPVLPQIVPAVLGTAQQAADAAESSTEARADEGSLELASGLAAVQSLVEGLGSFLSPQLPSILALTLRPSVRLCQANGCAAAARSVCNLLPTKVPMRLLLGPMAASVDACVQAGPDAVTGLLDMLGTASQAMDTQAAAGHTDDVFKLLVTVFDLRGRRTVGARDMDQIESAGVRALVAFVMKLSESKFKPLFLRLLEWASAPAGDGKALTARHATLFRAAGALAERLRSVFVPYFRYLLDLAMAHLAGDASAADAADKPKKKKQKKQQRDEEAGLEGGSLEDRLDTWTLRLQVRLEGPFASSLDPVPDTLSFRFTGRQGTACLLPVRHGWVPGRRKVRAHPASACRADRCSAPGRRGCPVGRG